MTTFADQRVDDLADFYRDLHRHPELSFQEHRTAGRILDAISGLGLDVHPGIGGTGIAAVLRNGDGPVVLLRADMDALPVQEKTGLDYASVDVGTDPDGHTVPVMHACGHDMHVTCLVGALRILAGARSEWSGTVVAVFQPAEERGSGAKAMVEDGLFEKVPVPQVVLGQHVGPLLAGQIAYRPGVALAGADVVTMRLFGRGGHGSRPETTVDPVVLASSVVLKLQTIVSRELSALTPAVVTVGYLRAGTKHNIIPDEAELGLSIRSFSPEVRDQILAAVERIARGEALAAGCGKDPEIVRHEGFDPLQNDPVATGRVAEAFLERFGRERVFELSEPITGSEDVGVFGAAVGAPTVFWFWGGFSQARFDADRGQVPSNHASDFAPEIEPTLSTGVEALVVAARAWLGRPASV
ncbi:amidohydrolase [Segniliparus rugosus]|uniref:Amidohydrolase n=1 Tax=Segniliparus rugosus (strain ATCC BAA-974 / DSM 45345 / CCUG 50838 / CIP 108380 / JCM 13579 / CDC 945) TaxID=679197 RepID=E5XKP6_SEGRC|nr:amidohydrolase [Segniliparus rugosus]EFV15093.1 amidohydrolase [Segniliparus rugosus ATCC BAA-974]